MGSCGRWMLDWTPVLALAMIAAAGSFTHIRDLAEQSGQYGWMAWATAIAIDLTCVMAARERHRDAQLNRRRRGVISWPTLVLVGAVLLTLAANLASARASVWGWVMAAVPAVAFLVAVSMLERRAIASSTSTAASIDTNTVEEVVTWQPANPAPPVNGNEAAPRAVESADPLIGYAAQVAADYQVKHGYPITVGALRSRLGVAEPVAVRLHAQLNEVEQKGGDARVLGG